MASGHVNRTNRPNTWLHRPACGREESPCQLGAVHTWHIRDIARSQIEVRFRCKSGRAADITAMTGFDPQPSFSAHKVFSAKLSPPADFAARGLLFSWPAFVTEHCGSRV